MAFRNRSLFLFSILLIFICYVNIVKSRAAPGSDEEPNKDVPQEPVRKCKIGESYHDGCNNCHCAGNHVTEDGKITPLIGCTLKLCHEDDGSVYIRKPAPPEFYE